jgi:glycosyltransferase involved in cell wall biosynthesis
VIPRLKRAGNQAKYIERPGFAEKIDLLRHAQALLITSDINETSSLVAMEAAACGTPVIALRRGALAEVIAEGITGLLAEDAEEMISASSNVFDIDERQCRVYAEHRYSSAKMADGYESLYRQVRMRGVPIA